MRTHRNDGTEIHLHRLRKFAEYEQAENAPYRYVCLDCGKKLKIMSGILAQQAEPTKEEKIKELVHRLSKLVPELYFLVEPTEHEIEEIAEWELPDEAYTYGEALQILDWRAILAERLK